MDNASKPVKENKTRALAGKALCVFLAVMLALTWGNRMLQEMTIATVARASIQRGALEKQVVRTGTLAGAVVVPITLEETVRVLDVYVEAGARVAQGDPLFRVDYTGVIERKADALKTAHETAQTKQRDLDWAAADLPAGTVADVLAVQSEAERRRLGSDPAISAYLTQYDEAKKAQDTLAEAEQAYQKALEAADEGGTEERYTLTYLSPVAGSVMESGVAVGSMAPTSSAAMLLCDQARGLALRVTVDASQASLMVVGDTATIIAGNQAFDSPVLSVTASATQSGMYEVGFLLDTDAASPGMGAQMRFVKRTENYDMLLPLTALRYDTKGSFVYVVEQQDTSLGARMSVRRVDVMVLDTDGSRAAIEGGLSQRDVIVTRSDRSIADGDRVRLEE